MRFARASAAVGRLVSGRLEQRLKYFRRRDSQRRQGSALHGATPRIGSPAKYWRESLQIRVRIPNAAFGARRAKRIPVRGNMTEVKFDAARQGRREHSSTIVAIIVNLGMHDDPLDPVDEFERAIIAVLQRLRGLAPTAVKNCVRGGDLCGVCGAS
jgi:hypothetical protein